MRFRSIAIHALSATVAAALMSMSANAQVQSNAQASSATHVAAEMTKGKLNPNESKPGDKVALRLKEDVKSNGQLILKKGTTIDGVVKSVKKVEGKGEANGKAQSMMEIEWLAPTAHGKATQQLSIALQSVSYISPMQRARESESAGDDWPARSSASGSVASTASAAGGAGGGLLAGVGSTVGAVVGSTATVATDVAGATGSVASNTTARAAGTSNVALMSMPSVVAADSQTTSSLESTFGLSSSSQLYKVGRGEVVSAGGTKESMDIYSHMSNDTVITSQSKNFEISSGAQMQLLVGVRK